MQPSIFQKIDAQTMQLQSTSGPVTLNGPSVSSNLDSLQKPASVLGLKNPEKTQYTAQLTDFNYNLCENKYEEHRK